MKTYETYKDSGIEWIGKIPEHWKTKRIDWSTKIIRGNTGFKKDELLDNGDYVALQYGKTYKINEVDSSFNFFVNSEFYKSNQIVKSGDVILISTSETVEDLGHSCFYSREDLALLGGEQIVLSPKKAFIEGKYLYYFSKVFCPQLRKYARGIKVFRFNIDDLKTIYTIIPPTGEQTAIANYLDKKTAEIDQLISEKEELVQLYQEEKTAIINQAVTKGINPGVTLKGSGIEWLGDIPEHWEVKPLKVMISKKIDNRGKTPQYSDTGKPMLEIKQISEKHKYPIEQFEKFVDIDILQNYVRDELMEGDILIATVGATAGKCCIVPKNPYYFIAQNVIGFRFHKEYSSDFVYYLIQSDFFKQSLYAINKSNTIDNLKVSVFVNNNVPTTEYSEQIEIAQHIEKESARIGAKIAKAEQYINLLTEYRTALISEVVTGKIKVID